MSTTSTNWLATPQALDAKHAAERAIDAHSTAMREGDARRALDALATAIATLLDKTDPPHTRALGEAMARAIGELDRAPRGDEGAVLASSAVLERALRALIAEVNGARAPKSA